MGSSLSAVWWFSTLVEHDVDPAGPEKNVTSKLLESGEKPVSIM